MVVRHTSYPKRENWQLTLAMQLYCILLPFEEILAGTFGSVVKLVGLFVMGYIAIVYKKIELHKDNYWLIAWVLLAAISVLWSESVDWWIEFFKIYASQTAFLIVVMSAPVGAIKISSVRKALIMGALIAALMLILMPQGSQYTDDGRRSIIMFGRSFDPNVLSGVLILGITSVLEEFFSVNKNKNQLLIIAAMLICVVGILLTGSRGGLLSVGVSIMVIVFYEFRSIQNRKKICGILMCSVAAFVVILPYLPKELLAERFSIDTIFGLNELESGAHNRYSIWESALKLIPDRPILGHGAGNFISAITKVYYRSCASHNMYLLVLVETGIVGFFLLMFFVYGLALKVLRYKLYTEAGQLCGILFLCVTLDGLPYKFFWMTILLLQIAVKNKEADDRIYVTRRKRIMRIWK